MAVLHSLFQAGDCQALDRRWRDHPERTASRCARWGMDRVIAALGSRSAVQVRERLLKVRARGTPVLQALARTLLGSSERFELGSPHELTRLSRVRGAKFIAVKLSTEIFADGREPIVTLTATTPCRLRWREDMSPYPTARHNELANNAMIELQDLAGPTVKVFRSVDSIFSEWTCRQGTLRSPFPETPLPDSR